MNFRVFETLGCGTELVTNDVPDLHKIAGLTDRIHIYKDFDDCVRIIDLILEQKLTTNGIQNQKWIKTYHSVYNRHKSLLNMVYTHEQEKF